MDSEAKYHYNTVLEALEKLKSMGFTVDYNLQEEAIISSPENYTIVHVYRYEGDTNPDEEAVVYGIQSVSGEKGVFVAGFAANSENSAVKTLNDLNIKGKK